MDKKEPEVVGPLTLRQFIIVSIGTTLSFVAYFALGAKNMPAAIGLMAVFMGIASIWAFVKISK